MTAILAIDPGTTTSAWLAVDDQGITSRQIGPNDDLLMALRGDSAWKRFVDTIVIERIEPRYGLRMGWETIETCELVGRLVEAAWPVPAVLLRRSDILRHFGVASRGSADSGIRAALMDRWGGSSSVRKGGPLFGIKTHLWSALSVGVAYREGLRPTNREEKP